MELQPVYYDLTSTRSEKLTPDQSSGTGNGVHQVPHKRPRLAKSCTLCRNKKLKCDRLLPCHQCSKFGRARQCTYDREDENVPQARATEQSNLENDQRRRKIPSPTGLAEVQSHVGPPDRAPTALVAGNSESIGMIEHLHNRVYKLEQLIYNQPHILPESSRQLSLGAKQRAGSSMYSGTLDVKGSRSRFHGQYQKMTLLNEVSPPGHAYLLAGCEILCSAERCSSMRRKRSFGIASKNRVLLQWSKSASHCKRMQ